MRKQWKRVMSTALCVAMAASVLGGCSSKQKETTASVKDAAAALVTAGDAAVSAGAGNVLFRMEQASLESSLGQLIQYYYGTTDLWNTDLMGNGQPYGDTFKEEFRETLTQLALVKEHAEELGVELSDDEKAAITAAAEQFLADNGEEVLAKMNATQETVEEALTLRTLQSKAEEVMGSDIDTEVSDEEAAQRTVSYVSWTATEQSTTEAVTEGISESTSEAAVETESEVKTSSAEAETAVESALETVDESATEAATEAVSEVEEETESAAMIEARAEMLASAEAFLAKAQASDEAFADLASQQTTDDTFAHTSSFTFGDDDTYPDTAIIEATKGLEDDAIVDHVVVVGATYYVLHVDDAFDEEATEEKKEEIVAQRRNDAISAKYTEWTDAEEIKIDEDIYGTQMLLDFSLSEETEAVTESAEAVTEAVEGTSEVVTEGGTETTQELAD